MRGRGTVWIGLIAVLALAGTAAGQAQAVTASLEASVDERPDALPGVYEANVTVTVQAPGGQCLCQETRIDLVGEAGEAEAIGFEPESYRIDWVQHALEGGGGEHEQTVGAAIAVPDVDEGPVEATLDVEMEHEPGHLVVSQTEPVTLELELPGEAESQQARAARASNDAANGDDEAVQAPGAGAGLAALSLALLARAGRWR